jgi:hypothetical protein
LQKPSLHKLGDSGKIWNIGIYCDSDKEKQAVIIGTMMEPLGYLFQSATSVVADDNDDGDESSSGLPPQDQELSPNNNKSGSCGISNSDSYKILGCAEGASPEEVKNAYKRAAGPVRAMFAHLSRDVEFWWRANETRLGTFSDAALSYLLIFGLPFFLPLSEVSCQSQSKQRNGSGSV